MSTETQREKFFTWEEVHEMAMQCHFSQEIIELCTVRLHSICDLAAKTAQSSGAAEMEALKEEIKELKAELDSAYASYDSLLRGQKSPLTTRPAG